MEVTVGQKVMIKKVEDCENVYPWIKKGTDMMDYFGKEVTVRRIINSKNHKYILIEECHSWIFSTSWISTELPRMYQGVDLGVYALDIDNMVSEESLSLLKFTFVVFQVIEKLRIANPELYEELDIKAFVEEILALDDFEKFEDFDFANASINDYFDINNSVKGLPFWVGVLGEISGIEESSYHFNDAINFDQICFDALEDASYTFLIEGGGRSFVGVLPCDGVTLSHEGGDVELIDVNQPFDIYEVYGSIELWKDALKLYAIEYDRYTGLLKEQTLDRSRVKNRKKKKVYTVISY